MITLTPELIEIGQMLERSSDEAGIVALHGDIFDWLNSCTQGRYSRGTIYLAFGLTLAALLDDNSPGVTAAQRRTTLEAIAVSAMAQLAPDPPTASTAIDLTGLAPEGEA